MEKFEVNSLSSFFNLLETKGFEDYIYRGESEKFDERNASVFRKSEGKKYNSVLTQEKFKNNVISNLTTQEQIHFTAFCQHHGIPTELLDFTYSPLIALYFACQINDAKEVKDEDGYIYLIKNERLVHVNDLIVKCGNSNLSEIILDEYGSEMYEELKNQMCKYFKNNLTKIKTDLIELIKNFDRFGYKLKLSTFSEIFRDNSNNSSEYTLHKLLTYIEGSESELKLQDYVKEVYEYSRGENFKEDRRSELWYNAAMLYLLLIRQFSFNCIISYAYNEQVDKANFNCNIIFAYDPPKIFKRIESQQGLFINQFNISRTVYGEIIVKQKIEHDHVIKINNKSDILKQLDRIGINQATVFGDYDNIARYICNKYSNSFEKRGN